MSPLQILADLNRAGFAVTFTPEFTAFGVVQVMLTLRRVPNPLYESDAPDVPVVGTANVWDADSYARALEAFHRIAFPEAH